MVLIGLDWGYRMSFIAWCYMAWEMEKGRLNLVRHGKSNFESITEPTVPGKWEKNSSDILEDSFEFRDAWSHCFWESRTEG